MAFRPLTAHEFRYRTEGVWSAWTACTTGNCTDLGGGQYRINGLDYDIAIGDLQVRVAASGGNPPSAVLSNTVAFTAGGLSVNAGSDKITNLTTATLTATETAGAFPIVSRLWTVLSYPVSQDPIPIGELYNKSSWTNLNDFNINKPSNTCWLVTSGKLVANPVPIAGEQIGYLSLDYLTFKDIKPNNDQTLKIELTYKAYYLATPVQPSAGPLDNSLGGAVVGLVRTTENIINNTRFIQNAIGASGGEIITLLIVASGRAVEYSRTGLIDYTDGNTLKFTIELSENGNKVYTALNQTTSETLISNEDNEDVNFNGIDLQLAYLPTYDPNYGTYRLEFDNVKVSSTMIKNPQILFVGDQKTVLPISGDITKRYGVKLADLLDKTYTIYGGYIQKTGDIINTLEYLEDNDVVPQMVILNVGRNDLFFGVSVEEWRPNYNTVVSRLKSLNPSATFIHVLPILEVIPDGISQVALYDYITDTFPTDNIYNPDDFGWNPATMTSDDVLPNDLGTTNLATGLQTFINSL